MPNSNSQKSIKNIEVGKFYLIHDGSRTGHPGLVVRKDDDKNRYLVIRFDSDKYGDVPKKERGVKHITKLSQPTNPLIMNSYVHNRPMLCKRKDIGILLTDLSIGKTDYPLIQAIKNRKPELVLH